jgi:hypothetical protein
MEHFPRPCDGDKIEHNEENNELRQASKPACDDMEIGCEPEHTCDEDSYIHHHEIRCKPEPYQKDSPEGMSSVAIKNDEMEQEFESTHNASQEGVSGEHFYNHSTEISYAHLLDISDTINAKNANDMNDTGHANDTNKMGHTNNIKNLEESVIMVLTAKVENDLELSASFKKCLSIKNKKMTDYKTLQNYLFIVNFNNKWFKQHVKV